MTGAVEESSTAPAGRRSPVLVTGSHRSGSTWVGRLLAAADELHYVQEPFNIVARQRWMVPRPEHQFLFVDERNEEQWTAPVERVLDLRYPLIDHLRRRPDVATARRMARIAFEARRARSTGAAALVKDPIALFSTPWLRRRFDVAAVVLVRDAVAFVGSLKEREWTFDFRHWTRQPELMGGLLAGFRDEIEAQVDRPGDIIEQGIVQWNAMYAAVDSMRRDDPSLIVVHYESIASDPQVEVEALYGRLGLAYTNRQADLVATLSTADRAATSAIDVKRNSADALVTWRERLDDDEIRRIRAATEDVAARLV